MIHFVSAIARTVFARSGGRFLRDQNATTAIEFGILSVPFFAIVGAILETALVFMSSQVLDSAVGDATRQIRTGQADAAAFNTAKFKALVCGELFGMFGDCSGLYTSVTTINDFSSVSVTPPVSATCTSACTWTQPEVYTASKGSNTVLVQVYYKWPVILDFAGFTFATLPDRTRLLAAVRVFRNEPF